MHTADPADNAPLFAHLLTPPTRRRWPRVVIGLSILGHAGVLAGLIAAGMWQIDKLRLERTAVVTASSFGIPGPAAAPAALPPAVRRRESPSTTTQKRRVAVAQPVDDAQIEQSIDDGGGDPAGSDDGGDDGVPGGVGSIGAPGLCAKPPCDVATGGLTVLPTCENGGKTGKECEAHETSILDPDVIDKLRTEGNTQIQPPDAVKNAIRSGGKSEVSALIKLCLDSGGDVASLKVVKSTAYPAYDQRLVDEMHDWKYRPYSVGGQPVPVCGMVTFVFRLK